MKTREKFDTSWYVEQERKIATSTARVRELRQQMRRQFDPGHLYVVEFDSGVVKVGRTSNVESRLKSHAMVGLIRLSWASERHRHCGKTERELLAYCNRHGQPYGGREYFTGVYFSSVVNFAEQLAELACAQGSADDEADDTADEDVA